MVMLDSSCTLDLHAGHDVILLRDFHPPVCVCFKKVSLFLTQSNYLQIAFSPQSSFHNNTRIVLVPGVQSMYILLCVPSMFGS